MGRLIVWMIVSLMGAVNLLLSSLLASGTLEFIVFANHFNLGASIMLVISLLKNNIYSLLILLRNLGIENLSD